MYPGDEETEWNNRAGMIVICPSCEEGEWRLTRRDV